MSNDNIKPNTRLIKPCLMTEYLKRGIHEEWEGYNDVFDFIPAMKSSSYYYYYDTQMYLDKLGVIYPVKTVRIKNIGDFVGLVSGRSVVAPSRLEESSKHKWIHYTGDLVGVRKMDYCDPKGCKWDVTLKYYMCDNNDAHMLVSECDKVVSAKNTWNKRHKVMVFYEHMLKTHATHNITKNDTMRFLQSSMYRWSGLFNSEKLVGYQRDNSRAFTYHEWHDVLHHSVTNLRSQTGNLNYYQMFASIYEYKPIDFSKKPNTEFVWTKEHYSYFLPGDYNPNHDITEWNKNMYFSRI